MTEFDAMKFAAGGMDAQRGALDVYARNVALMQTADRAHPIHPLEPSYAVANDDDGGIDGEFAAEMSRLSGDGDDSGDDDVLPGAISFAGAKPSATLATGGDAVAEMVSVLDAQRAYEANASVFDSGKRLVEKTIAVGSS